MFPSLDRPIGRRTALRGAAAAAAVLTLAGSLAACGGEDSTAADGSKVVTVNAGFIPVIDVAALYLGDEKGFFEDQGLKLKVNTGQGGAALVPPVVSGEYQFAFSNMVSVLQARSKGLPLKIIAAGSSSTATDGADISMVHVAKGSSITSPAELEGKKVAVNTVGNLLEMLGRVAVDADGGDSDKVQFVELGFSEAVQAMESGEIDAMVGAEPFDTIASAADNAVISSPYLNMSDSSMLTSVYFTSEQQLQKDPETFEKLVKAIDTSLEYAQEHPDEVRAQLSNYTEIESATIDKVVLPTFAPDIPEDSVDTFIEYADKYGFLEDDVSYDDVVWKP